MKIQFNKKIQLLFILSILFWMIPILSYATQNNKLTSSKYAVSELYDYIFRIEPNTTLQSFIAKFNIDDRSNLHIYKDNSRKKEITTGNIGTGMVLTYGSQQYRLSVIGDLNKNGKIETIELNNLIKYIVNKQRYPLEELQLLSVDMNMDGKVDIIDVTNMIRYLVFNKLEGTINVKTPAPTIVVKVGAEEAQGYYNNNITFSIQNENSKIKILKNIYSMIGKMNQEEKEINKNDTITLTEEGTYQIKMYAYSVYGTKSEQSTKTLVIDRKAPEIGNIQIDNQNVNTAKVKLTNLTDNLSGLYQISFSQDEERYNWEQNEEANFTKEINRNGTWYIAVKDKSGNITKQSVQIEGIKPKVQQVQVNIEGFVGVQENTNMHIICDGEPKEIHFNVKDNTIADITKESMQKTPINDEKGYTIGYDINVPVRGLKEEETVIEIVVKNYDGTQITNVQSINVVDKTKGIVLVGKNYYSSVTKAIEAINKQENIIILKNIVEDILIPQGKEITLEIGYYTITGRINNQGKLTIPSGTVINQEETIYNVGEVNISNATITSNAIAIHNLVGAKTIVKKGNILSQNNNAILNYGTMQVDDSLIQTNAQDMVAVSNQISGVLSITSGQINASKNTAINNNGKLTLGIKDGNINNTSLTVVAKNNGVYTTGTLNWFDGNIIATQAIVGNITTLETGYLMNIQIKNNVQVAMLTAPKYQIGNKKYATLKEAIQIAKDGETIQLLKDATDYSDVIINKKIILDLNNHTLTRNKQIEIKYTGELIIKEGTLQSTSENAIKLNIGKIKVEQANIIGNQNGIAQSESSQIEVISGTVQGNMYGIKSESQANTIILGDNTKAINLNNPVIIGGKYGVYADAGTSVYYFSGIIQGKEEPGYHIEQVPIYRSDYIMNVNKQNENYLTQLIVKQDYKVFVKESAYIKYYETLAKAIEEAKQTRKRN